MTDYLSQDSYTFDQTDDGWRGLDKEAKYLEAAQLIERYISQNQENIAAQNKVSIQTMYFHAGQEYAMAGEQYYAAALSNFTKSYKQREAWDIYVDGTIAFLQRDVKSLSQAAGKLAVLAINDVMQRSNARLLGNFLVALGRGNYSYSAVYDNSPS